MSVAALRLSERRSVGPGHPALVVAEIGQNHNGRHDWAEQLIDAAAWSGADAVKTVKRNLSCELTAAAARRRHDSPHSFGKTYGEHRQVLELEVEIHEKLARRARSLGLIFITTVCDIPSASEMNAIGVDVFKVASRDLNNLPLIEYLSSLGRPIILSTGMSDWSEIDAAIEVMRSSRSAWALLQCTSLYPTPDDAVNLNAIPALAKRYDAVVGFSDHTSGVEIAPSAVALGASIIEKHLTLDRRAKGTDHACSSEPAELLQLVERIRRIERALGSDEKTIATGVATTREKLGRSLVVNSSLSAGTVLQESMFVLKSPGGGISWVDRAEVVGRRLLRDVPADTTLTFDDVC